MNSSQDSLFDKAMASYQEGADAMELIPDFEAITASAPNQSAGWTCLAWLQLLCDENQAALRSARTAVRLNSQDPQARINLSLALLETNSKGVREHIEFVKRAILVVPEFEKELLNAVNDGLQRKPDWPALIKVKDWLGL